ncbi:hypothetical protein R1sor_022573 [Riccia sorocarpa]|uniref:Uncharacterized protein n=1 Tax=Riccia sorocarpa TaxID=122646 RepID=A0ABD3GM92_9MARC
MTPTFSEAEEDVRLRAVGGDEAGKFRSHLRNDIKLQLESATGKLFALESKIANVVYAGNKEGAIREIYDAHGNSQDARYHIRRAMQLVNVVLAPDDDSLDGRWRTKFGELEATGEERAMEVADFLCKCNEANPRVPGYVVHDDQGRPHVGERQSPQDTEILSDAEEAVGVSLTSTELQEDPDDWLNIDDEEAGLQETIGNMQSPEPI